MATQNENLNTAILGLGAPGSRISLDQVIDTAAATLQSSDEQIIKLLANAGKFPQGTQNRIGKELRIDRTVLVVRKDISGATQTLNIIDDMAAAARGITPFDKGEFPSYMEAGVITGISVAYSRVANTVTLGNAAYSNQSIHAEMNGALTADLDLQVSGGATYTYPHRAFLPASTLVPGLASADANVYALAQGIPFKKDDKLKAMMNLASGVTLTPTTNFLLYAEYSFTVIFLRTK